MSLAPLVHPEVRGVEGKDPEVSVICSVPGCISRSQEGHHMWPRSYLRGQPTGWVRVPSGQVIGNKTGLCRRHHKMVTGDIGGHTAWIRLEPGDVLVWYEKVDENHWVGQGKLNPQPPIIGDRVKAHLDAHTEAASPHVHLADGETCKECGYTKPVKREPQPKRESATWTVVVPADTEVGAEVLDEWVEQFAVLMGIEPDGGKRLMRYHVLSVVLAWADQNRQLLIEDLAEAAAV